MKFRIECFCEFVDDYETCEYVIHFHYDVFNRFFDSMSTYVDMFRTFMKFKNFE